MLLAAAGGCRNFAEPPAFLEVSPFRLTFSGVAQGQYPPAQALSIYQLGAGALHWAAQADVPWLSISPDSGTAPATAWIEARTDGMAPGGYSGRIVVVATGPGAGRASVSATLEVRQTASLTGRWVGVGTTANLAVSLADSGGIVTGSGDVSPNVGSVSIAGTHQGSTVSLNLTAAGGALVAYSGSLVDDNTMLGTLSGAGLSEVRFALYRQ
jgi:hypothetical protein